MCAACGVFHAPEKWNTRPIESALRGELTNEQANSKMLDEVNVALRKEVEAWMKEAKYFANECESFREQITSMREVASVKSEVYEKRRKEIEELREFQAEDKRVIEKLMAELALKESKV